MTNNKKSAKLMYGTGVNFQYICGFDCPDAFVWYQDSKGKTYLLLSALEIDRGRKVAKVDKVVSLTDVAAELRAENKVCSPAEQVLWLAKKCGDTVIEVPYDFPAGLANELTASKLQISPKKGVFFFERTIKSLEEVRKLREAQQINQKAFIHAFDILDQAEIAADNSLIWNGEILTSEILRGEMNSLLAKHGCTDFNDGPIVACGAQAADPHAHGTGALKAHELILFDCFPKAANGYNGDLSRTVVKGKPSQWQQDIFAAVKGAQQLALDMLAPGVNGKDIHQAVRDFLDQAGFPTGIDEQGRNFGFFHGTGHSVGLELHDPGVRTISAVDCELKPGHVTSVEPGLYYPDKGGVRIEDVGVITETGFDNFTTLPKNLII